MQDLFSKIRDFTVDKGVCGNDGSFYSAKLKDLEIKYFKKNDFENEGDNFEIITVKKKRNLVFEERHGEGAFSYSSSSKDWAFYFDEL